MPGLFGFVRLEPGGIDPAVADTRLADARLADTRLAGMAARLCHVGNERVETWIEPGGGFAIGRVAQPHVSPQAWPAARDQSGAVFVHGILHPRTRGPEQCLAEVRRRGAAAFRELRGFFSAVTRDAPSGLTHLATDYRGSCPLLYTELGGTLYFAPETKAFLSVPDFAPDVDLAALGTFLASGFVPVHQNLLRWVHRIEGGQVLTIAGRQVRLERYRDHRLTVEGDGTPPAKLEDELIEAMRAAVARNYLDPEQDVIFLSGGRDSRALLGGALASLGSDARRVRVVSWASDDAPAGSDVAIAREIAAEHGLHHTVIRRSIEKFGRHASKLNHVLEASSDVGVFHGYELEIMRRLAESGVRRVLRGDQCFTYGIRALDATNSMLKMCLRSAEMPRGLLEILHPEIRGEIGEASDVAFEELVRGYDGVQPDNVADEVYFRHRLQGYLNTAGYFKQLYLDHRNPLLDEDLLDLVLRTSVADRVDQRLFRRAAARAFPELWKLPIAVRSNLESYDALLAADTPVRRFVAGELADEKSLAWEYLDRGALLALLEAHGKAPASRPWASELKTKVRKKARKALDLVPPLQRRVRHRYLMHANKPEELFFRAVALKQWFDGFLGSRRRSEIDAGG